MQLTHLAGQFYSLIMLHISVTAACFADPDWPLSKNQSFIISILKNILELSRRESLPGCIWVDSLRSYSSCTNVTLIAFIFSLHYEAAICFRSLTRWFIGSALAASFLMDRCNRPRKRRVRRRARGGHVKICLLSVSFKY